MMGDVEDQFRNRVKHIPDEEAYVDRRKDPFRRPQVACVKPVPERPVERVF